MSVSGDLYCGTLQFLSKRISDWVKAGAGPVEIGICLVAGILGAGKEGA